MITSSSSPLASTTAPLASTQIEKYPGFAESVRVLQEIADEDRRIHGNEVARLNRVIVQLCEERGVHLAELERLRSQLAAVEGDAKQWQSLQVRINGNIVDEISDMMGAATRRTIKVDHRELSIVEIKSSLVHVDLSDEEFIPRYVEFSRELSDGTNPRFSATLMNEKESFVYHVKYVSG